MSSTQSTMVQLPAPHQLREPRADGQDADLGALDTDGQENGPRKCKSESNDPSPPSSEDEEEEETAETGVWSRWSEDMRRLTAAAKRAIALSEDLGTTDDAKTVDISFGGDRFYRVPWEACRTWRRMEVFLKEWFRQDKFVLAAINDGQFTISETFDVVISPGLWQTLVRPGQRLKFSLQSLAAALPPEPAPVDDEDGPHETSYENRVQYKVSYYRRHEFGGRSEFVSQSVYTEPVEFEVAEAYGKLPVLEESKRVESSPESARNPSSSDRAVRGRHPKLWQPDSVSEPVLKINSPYLLNILKAVITCSAEPPAGNNEGLDAGVFAYPFRDLYLHLDDLLDYKTGNSNLRQRHSGAFNTLADAHIDVLRHYLETQPTIQYMEAKKRCTGGIPTTTFSTFWLLMKPGTDVYVRETDGSLNCYVLDRLNGGIYRDTSDKQVTTKYTAQVWNLVLDDRAIRQYTRHIDIQVFDDERQITELPVFPVKYIDQLDDGSTRQALIDRGKKYFAYSKRPSFLQYDGQGLKPGLRLYKRSRVVVEHASRPWANGGTWGSELNHYMPENRVPDTATPMRAPLPGGLVLPPPPPPPLGVMPIVGESLRVARCECKECQAYAASKETYLKLNFSSYREIHPTRQAELTDHQYSILPSHMFAFVLNDRNYDLVDVAKLSEPSMAETAIDRLVMPAPLKELIKAIAKTYTDSSEMFSADFIHGKGEGQIVLLHGPPGTGKTLTAESVAEYTRRPLLSITAADLGHEPDALEKSLLQYFRRANDWDAIVLLDEADVYLEKRSTSDLERNSIVSVFLRALDYFQGILFLTTNRVAQFDEAFMSRIHLSLGYDKLSDDARTQIWGNLFQKLKDDHKSGGPKIKYDYDAKRYVTKDDEVKALQWNGREIRNAFQTAVALAVYDSKAKSKTGEPSVPEVTEDHLKQVVSMSSAFRRYITAAHEGMDDSVWAFKHGNRDDSITAAPKQ